MRPAKPPPEGQAFMMTHDGIVPITAKGARLDGRGSVDADKMVGGDAAVIRAIEQSVEGPSVEYVPRAEPRSYTPNRITIDERPTHSLEITVDERPLDVLKMARARIAQLRKEVARIRRLEQELAELERLVAAAKEKKSAPVRPIKPALAR